MPKNYKIDKQLVVDVKKDINRIEKKHQSKVKARKKKKQEQEDLSQRWLAPFLLFATLILGYLLYIIY